MNLTLAAAEQCDNFACLPAATQVAIVLMTGIVIVVLILWAMFS